VLGFSGTSVNASVIYKQTDDTGTETLSQFTTTFVSPVTGIANSAKAYGSAFNRNLSPFGPTSRSLTIYVGSSTVGNIQTSGTPYCKFEFGHAYGGNEDLQDFSTDDGYSAITPSTAGGCDFVTGNTYAIQYGDSSQVSFATSYGAPYVGRDVSNTYATFSFYTDATPPPEVSSVTLTSPNAQVYNGNPIQFGGLYTNVDTYNQIQFDVVYATSTPILEFPVYPLSSLSGVDLDWGLMDYHLAYAGPYTVRARLYDTGTGSSTDWTATTSFAIATTTLNPIYSVDSVISSVACDEGALFCFAQQIIGWAVKPSTASIDRLMSLSDDLSVRTPFVYLYQISDLVTEGFTATQTASSSVVIHGIGSMSSASTTLISASMVQNMPLSATIKLALTYALWILFATVVYIRGKSVFNKD